jgi:hypothetical protein
MILLALFIFLFHHDHCEVHRMARNNDFFVTSKSGRYFNERTKRWVSFSDAMATSDKVSAARQFPDAKHAQTAAHGDDDLQITRGRYR